MSNETKELIGKGTFSKVYKVFDETKNKYIAIKRVKKKNLTIKMQIQFKEEVKIAKSLIHPNIVRVYNVSEYEKFSDIFMEYFPSKTLDHYMKKKGLFLTNHGAGLGETKTKKILTQLKSCIEYLKLHNIMHRDIKPQNVLIDKNGKIKLIDFGFSKILRQHDELSHTICGTPLYMSPEILMSNQYTMKSELWSIGILTFYLIFGNHPFGILTTLKELINKLQNNHFMYVIAQLKGEISKECYDLLLSLCEFYPENRITFDDFFNHQWFKEQNIDEDFSFRMIENYENSNSIEIPIDNVKIQNHSYTFKNFLNISVELLKSSMNGYLHSI